MNEFRASIPCNQNKSFLEFKMFQLFRDAVNLIESLKFDSGSFVSKMSDCATLYLFISEDKKDPVVEGFYYIFYPIIINLVAFNCCVKMVIGLN